MSYLEVVQLSNEVREAVIPPPCSGVDRRYSTEWIRIMRRKWSLLSLLLMLAFTVLRAGGAAGKFYPDDPITREPETRDASNAQPVDIDLLWDLAYNLFARPGDPNTNVRARNVNTIDEVPDSSWFTNRILARPLSVEEVARGPVTGDGPAPGLWTIIRPKASGVSPGFTMRDVRGDVWFVSFDAKDHPEAASGAIMVANKIFWALGYWQGENHLISIRPENLQFDKDATIRVASGKRRPMRQSDLDDVLRRSERSPEGSYRAIASKLLPGKVLGGFKYFGTRTDDPNDVIPHEHRRELRALKVFGAWTNLTDMKAGNTVDTVVQENGKGIVRHYLQDVGSTFGDGAVGPHDYDEGWEHLYDKTPLVKRLVTLGFYISPWQTARYEENRSIGRFESKAFDPETWKPRVPTSAFLHARSDDNFWAARRVMAFSDEMIRSIVKTANYSDPAAEKLLAEMLIARRNKIGHAYLPAVNPLVDFAFENGILSFTNVAVKAEVAPYPAGGYSAEFSLFDNLTNQTRPISTATTEQGERIQAPAGLPTEDGAFLKVQVVPRQPQLASWSVPIDLYFRRDAGRWKLVGLERN
jgi:hypothetical protein